MIRGNHTDPQVQLFFAHGYFNTTVLRSPPFGDISAEEMATYLDRIKAAKADCLWVGMTAPKQEIWMRDHRDALAGIPVVAGIGAAFDFYAGTRERSSAWFQERGLEWLPRLVREPRRLWRRTIISAPRFLRLVWNDRRRD